MNQRFSAPAKALSVPPWRWFLNLAVGLVLVVLGCSNNPTLEEQLGQCWRFADLKNADQPEAADLLGPRPDVPTEPVTPAEAARLDAEFLLRQPLHIERVRLDRPRSSKVHGQEAPRFILTTRGSGASETLKVQGDKGIDRIQRVVTNPDLVVEVRDGRLHGIEVRLGS